MIKVEQRIYSPLPADISMPPGVLSVGVTGSIGAEPAMSSSNSLLTQVNVRVEELKKRLNGADHPLSYDEKVRLFEDVSGIYGQVDPESVVHKEEKSHRSPRALTPLEDLFLGGTVGGKKSKALEQSSVTTKSDIRKELFGLERVGGIINRARRGDYLEFPELFKPANIRGNGDTHEALQETNELRSRYGFMEGNSFKIFKKNKTDEWGHKVSNTDTGHAIRIHLSDMMDNGLIKGEWKVYLVERSEASMHPVSWDSVSPEMHIEVEDVFKDIFTLVPVKDQPYMLLSVKAKSAIFGTNTC